MQAQAQAQQQLAQQGYYAAPSAPSEMSSLMVAAGVALGGLGIPSYMDLERHYAELSDQKRRWEEMMERTDRLMAGMKRTLDEMRGLAAQQTMAMHLGGHSPSQQGQQQQGQGSPSQQQGGGGASPQAQPATAPSPVVAPAAVPLSRPTAAGERERASGSVWAVEPAA